jgi:hypothetical protein
LYCLSFCDLPILINTFVSPNFFLNHDDQQFYQKQQSVQLHVSSNQLAQKQTTTHDVGISDPVLRQAHNNGQQKKDKRQTMIHKTLQRKLKIEQHEARQKLDVNLGGPIKFYVCRTNQMAQKQTTTHDVGISDPVLRQAHKSGGVILKQLIRFS